METIKLRAEDIGVMYAHAEREYPHECCGVVIGEKNDPTKNEARPCKNIQNEMREKQPEMFKRSADTGYFMDPHDVRKAFEDAKKNNLEVLGFYHSHPDHDIYWSQEDHRAAMWAGTDEPSFPDASNIIISVREGTATGAAIFMWDNESQTFERSDIA